VSLIFTTYLLEINNEMLNLLNVLFINGYFLLV